MSWGPGGQRLPRSWYVPGGSPAAGVGSVSARRACARPESTSLASDARAPPPPPALPTCGGSRPPATRGRSAERPAPASEYLPTVHSSARPSLPPSLPQRVRGPLLSGRGASRRRGRPLPTAGRPFLMPGWVLRDAGVGSGRRGGPCRSRRWVPPDAEVGSGCGVGTLPIPGRIPDAGTGHSWAGLGFSRCSGWVPPDARVGSGHSESLRTLRWARDAGWVSPDATQGPSERQVGLCTLGCRAGPFHTWGAACILRGVGRAPSSLGRGPRRLTPRGARPVLLPALGYYFVV